MITFNIHIGADSQPVIWATNSTTNNNVVPHYLLNDSMYKAFDIAPTPTDFDSTYYTSSTADPLPHPRASLLAIHSAGRHSRLRSGHLSTPAARGYSSFAFGR